MGNEGTPSGPVKVVGHAASTPASVQGGDIKAALPSARPSFSSDTTQRATELRKLVSGYATLYGMQSRITLLGNRLADLAVPGVVTAKVLECWEAESNIPPALTADVDRALKLLQATAIETLDGRTIQNWTDGNLVLIMVKQTGDKIIFRRVMGPKAEPHYGNTPSIPLGKILEVMAVSLTPQEFNQTSVSHQVGASLEKANEENHPLTSVFTFDTLEEYGAKRGVNLFLGALPPRKIDGEYWIIAVGARRASPEYVTDVLLPFNVSELKEYLREQGLSPEQQEVAAKKVRPNEDALAGAIEYASAEIFYGHLVHIPYDTTTVGDVEVPSVLEPEILRAVRDLH